KGGEDERRANFFYTGTHTLTDYAPLPRQDYTAIDNQITKPMKSWHEWSNKDQVGTLPEWPPVLKVGKAPYNWRRQALFIKDDDPAGVGYYVLRDTLTGGQPTMWQFWSVTEKIGSPEQARDVTAFLADKPGNTVVPPRELRGNRFTGIGPFGVDLEYYIASPTDTPRYTLRWGTKQIATPNNGFNDYQDMLHLQLTGDGVYYVVIYPRKRTEPVPLFQTLGNGTVIKVSGAFGRDYCFLSGTEAYGAGEGAVFHGTCASVQDRTGCLLLALGAKGSVSYKGCRLESDFPVSLRSDKSGLLLETQQKVADGVNSLKPFPGGKMVFTAPGAWTLEKPAPGVALEEAEGAYTVTLPEGVTRVSLVKKK
ncbi:MAG TPA: hypothetical protein VGM23_04495, partial [Armatimonadota bacterium]